MFECKFSRVLSFVNFEIRWTNLLLAVLTYDEPQLYLFIWLNLMFCVYLTITSEILPVFSTLHSGDNGILLEVFRLRNLIYFLLAPGWKSILLGPDWVWIHIHLISEPQFVKGHQSYALGHRVRFYILHSVFIVSVLMVNTKRNTVYWQLTNRTEELILSLCLLVHTV